jgi:hypothetical protein
VGIIIIIWIEIIGEGIINFNNKKEIKEAFLLRLVLLVDKIIIKFLEDIAEKEINNLNNINYSLNKKQIMMTDTVI